MRTLVVLSLFLAGCLAQGGFPTTGAGAGTFRAPGTTFTTGTGGTFTTGTGGVQFSQPGVGTSFTTGVGQPGVGTGFRTGTGVGGPFQTGMTGTGFVGQPGVGTGMQPGMMFQPGMTSGVGTGTFMQPGMATGTFPTGMSTGTIMQPGMTQPGVTTGTFQPGITQTGVATGTFQPGVGFTTGVGTGMQPGLTQPGVSTGTFQPGVGVGTGFTGMTQTGSGMTFQPGMTTGAGGINQALQTQFITQGGQATGGFGTMGPFGSTSVPGTTGFVGSQFLGPPGLTGPQMQVPLSPIAALMMSLARNPNNYRYATCMFNDTTSIVKGRIDLRQFLIGEGRNMVNVRIQLAGLPQSSINVERGIHIHEFGDIGDMCSRVGPHFNPTGTPHGRRINFAWLRHVGDLGNILQSPEGLVSTQFSDMVISMEGINNIVGRSIVITQERDDEGFGGNTDSQINGNARTPLACCTISRTTSRNWFMPLSAQNLQDMAMTQILPDETFPQFNAGTNFNIVNGGMVSQVNPNAAFGTSQNGLGQVSFSPTGTNGQSFVFASQGKKK